MHIAYNPHGWVCPSVNALFQWEWGCVSQENATTAILELKVGSQQILVLKVDSPLWHAGFTKKNGK